MLGAVMAASLSLSTTSSLLDLAPSDRLDDLAAKVAEQALTKFGQQGLKTDQLAVTIIEIERAGKPHLMGHYRGNEPFYPASVVKLFYLAYAHRLLEDKKLKQSPELNRALTDMIVESSNDATGLVLETITGTTGGPELSPAELKKWMDKRNAVNRW